MNNSNILKNIKRLLISRNFKDLILLIENQNINNFDSKDLDIFLGLTISEKYFNDSNYIELIDYLFVILKNHFLNDIEIFAYILSKCAYMIDNDISTYILTQLLFYYYQQNLNTSSLGDIYEFVVEYLKKYNNLKILDSNFVFENIVSQLSKNKRFDLVVNGISDLEIYLLYRELKNRNIVVNIVIYNCDRIIDYNIIESYDFSYRGFKKEPLIDFKKKIGKKFTIDKIFSINFDNFDDNENLVINNIKIILDSSIDKYQDKKNIFIERSRSKYRDYYYIIISEIIKKDNIKYIYRRLKYYKNKSELYGIVKKINKNMITESQSIMLADIYYRLDLYNKAFNLIKKNFRNEVVVSKKILLKILNKTNDTRLINSIKKFINSNKFNSESDFDLIEDENNTKWL